MAQCPSCGNECPEVKEKTVLHQVKAPWRIERGRRRFYCGNAVCDAVYFSDDGSLIREPEIRQGATQGLICHCFDVALKDALDDPGLKEFVSGLTKEGLCACEARNPSGKCCLKDFPKTP